MVAWDRYTLAAQAVDHQLQFPQALAHKEVVLEISCTAKSGGRTDLLGVLYDELARCLAAFVVLCGGVPPLVFTLCVHRKKWEDLSGKLGSCFDLVTASQRDTVWLVGGIHVCV